MKKNFLPFAALMFLCAVFFAVAGAWLSFPSAPQSTPAPAFAPFCPFHVHPLPEPFPAPLPALRALF